MTPPLTRVAPAKINLALHVTGQRSDGYHELDTLITFAKVGDRLTFSPSDWLTLTVSGPQSDFLSADDDNLVLKAVRALINWCDENAVGHKNGVAIHLEKNLPVASGIGGGSADAAATLLGLRDFWEVGISNDDLAGLGLSLGADVPMCLNGKPLQASGVGERLKLVPLPAFHCVLVNPMKPVSTPAVFAALKQKNNAPLTFDGDGSHWLAQISDNRNDLENPARSLEPAIDDCLHSLANSSGCQLARMSGSGATCFGLYENADDAQTAAHMIQSKHRDWWVVPTTTIAA